MYVPSPLSRIDAFLGLPSGSFKGGGAGGGHPIALWGAHYKSEAKRS